MKWGKEFGNGGFGNGEMGGVDCGSGAVRDWSEENNVRGRNAANEELGGRVRVVNRTETRRLVGKAPGGAFEAHHFPT
jgi:hypothetical protein